MLTKNICHQCRVLYNGFLGIVQGLAYHDDVSTTGPPYCVLVEFDEYRGPSAATKSDHCIVPIVPETVLFDPKCGHSGSWVEFALVLGWAITIHKSKGPTLNKGVLQPPGTSSYTEHFHAVISNFRYRVIGDNLGANHARPQSEHIDPTTRETRNHEDKAFDCTSALGLLCIVLSLFFIRQCVHSPSVPSYKHSSHN